MAKGFDLLVMGDLCVDLILTGRNVAPVFGQVETLVDDATLALGGSSALVACDAARFGLAVAFAGRVGDDHFGAFLRGEMSRRGVDTTCLEVSPGEKTGITVHLSHPGDRAMLTCSGTIATFGAEAVPTHLVTRVRHLHLGSFYLQPALQIILPEVLRHARQSGATTSLDPGWDPANWWDGGLNALLPYLSFLLPNEQEATRITGISDPEQAARALSRNGTTVVVKRGAAGALLSTAYGIRDFAAYPACPVDTTGAGDAFDAGFLYGTLRGKPVEEAVRCGLACGARAVQTVGGCDAVPTGPELERLLADGRTKD